MLKNVKDIEYDRSLLSVFCKKYKIEFLILYGSYARKKADKFSDIDIAFVSYWKIAFTKYLAMYDEIIDIFWGKDIDFKNFLDIGIVIKNQILIDGIVLYWNKRAFASFKMKYILIFNEDFNRWYQSIKT